MSRDHWSENDIGVRFSVMAELCAARRILSVRLLHTRAISIKHLRYLIYRYTNNGQVQPPLTTYRSAQGSQVASPQDKYIQFSSLIA